MGSTSSKFKKYLQHGDEFAAMQLFQSSPDLRRSLDPNISYGESHNLNTALHYAAGHSMKHLLRTFLNDLGGNPNKRNGANESSLHAACRGALGPPQRALSAQERRAACVLMLLQWRGPAAQPAAQPEKVDVDALDKEGNTALHLAAASGLKKCVEMLAAAGAGLFLQNSQRQTPLDVAVAAQHHVIALLLESKMVFADPADSINEADVPAELPAAEEAPRELYSGLRAQDLQEAKDQLLVEAADMLHVPLFIADALLRDNDWSKTALLERWIASSVECCESAGVQVPAVLLASGTVLSPLDQKLICSDSQQAGAVTCDICCEEYTPGETRASTACRHRFCVACWRSYLEVRIRGGDAHHILCPAHGCNFLVPLELIETLVSRELASRYLQFDIKAFVETNRTIQWCPVAGCGRAVRYPEPGRSGRPRTAPQLLATPTPISHAVDCGAAHFFCWECLGEPHPPVCCERWAEWQRKVVEVRPDQLRNTWTETEDAANTLWLVTNSKPCPNCRSPIQKHEGCNHMRCSKCKHDFCWMCLEGWKKHSSATGGYFRCNKLDAQLKVDGRHDLHLMQAQVRNSQMQELARFVQLYEKFERQRERRQTERPLLESAAEKMKTLANSSTAAQKGIEWEALRFVEQSLRELAKARLLLAGSYVFAYFMTDVSTYSVNVFHFLQSELEEATECLATMAALPYLKTPMPTIVATTHLVRRKRDEFLQACERGLVPSEPPLELRGHRAAPWGRQLGLALSGASQLPAQVVATLSELEPASAWSRDVQTNLSAMYDWPDVDWEEEEEEDEDDALSALAARLLVQCRRQGCSRQRARNPRTGTTHDYCSLKCSRMDMLGELMDQGGSVAGDYNMELRIALEMSRLQHLEELNKQRQQGTGDQGAGTSSGAAAAPASCTEHAPDRLATTGAAAGRVSPVRSEPPAASAGAEQTATRRRCQSLGDLRCASPQSPSLDSSSEAATETVSAPEADPADQEVTDILRRRPPPARDSSSRLSGHVADDESVSSASDGRGAAALTAGLHIVVQRPALETESSAECESETGIPRSPTLYISGVSISRSPESAAAAAVSPRHARSPSLTLPPLVVPVPVAGQRGRALSLVADSGALPPPPPAPPLPPPLVLGPAATEPPPAAGGGGGGGEARTARSSSLSLLQLSPATPPPLSAELRASKSASDAEKRGDVFQFPVSPSDGQLSCVLHVEESTLSSDDFHEALFLDKSPKGRRKRSRRDRGGSGGGRKPL